MSDPAPPPVTPNPNCLETRTSNKNQHPGQLHNTYTAKRRTKEEMLEARCIEAEEKARKAEEVERQVIKQRELMRRIAEYEEELQTLNIDDTPVAPAGQLKRPAVEATPIPQSRHLR